MEIFYISPSGERWNLTGEQHSGLWVVEGGISGFIGDSDDVVTENRYGSRLVNWSVKQMNGSLRLLIPGYGDSQGENERTVSEIFYAWRNALSRHDAGTLIMETDERGTLYTPVRLSNIGGFPDRDPKGQENLEFTTEFVSDAGMWMVDSDVIGNGTAVPIINDGDADIWVTLHWEKASTVKLPSGVVLSLPKVTGEHSIVLNGDTGVSIINADGKPQYELLKRLGWTAAPEGIPVGAEAEFTPSDGVVISWTTSYLDPLRG